MRKRHLVFKLCRAASVAASVIGLTVMAAADSVVDQELFCLQMLLGMLALLCGAGHYMAFKYMELYQRERERRR